MSKICEKLGCSNSDPHNKILFGLELELESVLDYKENKIHFLRDVKKDDSLRNSGLEFISSPCDLSEAVQFFNDVMHTPAVAWHNKEDRCSERGSIHVHVNCKHLDERVVLNILRLYAMLEPGFFDFIEPHRRNNIYCVPLSSTPLVYKIHSGCLDTVVGNWHKYTALNAKPLYELGTLEFRHLEAMDSTAKLTQWLNIINRLFEVANVRQLDISFEELLAIYIDIFSKNPDNQLTEALKLCYQEDVVYRTTFTAKTLTERVRQFKQQEKVACAA